MAIWFSKEPLIYFSSRIYLVLTKLSETIFFTIYKAAPIEEVPSIPIKVLILLGFEAIYILC
jgi:hypothetical protein